jgi:uncharacterized protein (DUF58 family)
LNTQMRFGAAVHTYAVSDSSPAVTAYASLYELFMQQVNRFRCLLSHSSFYSPEGRSAHAVQIRLTWSPLAQFSEAGRSSSKRRRLGLRCLRTPLLDSAQTSPISKHKAMLEYAHTCSRL